MSRNGWYLVSGLNWLCVILNAYNLGVRFSIVTAALLVWCLFWGTISFGMARGATQ